MRILLDECVPRPVRRELPGYDVRTAADMGWAGKTNGELIALVASEGFDVFLTVDQNLRFQQNLRAAQVTVIVLFPRTNRLVDITPLMPKVVIALESIRRGEIAEIRA